jgi:hypothetical protein
MADLKESLCHWFRLLLEGINCHRCLLSLSPLSTPTSECFWSDCDSEFVRCVDLKEVKRLLCPVPFPYGGGMACRV